MSDNPQPLLVEIDLPVRGYDIDFAGIVSNIVYIRWLEDLRTTVLERYFPLEHQVAAGYAPVLTSTQIDYVRAITLFDRPRGRMWATGLDKVRWTLSAEIVVDGAVAARATQVGVFVRLDTKRPMAIPAQLRAVYEQARTGVE